MPPTAHDLNNPATLVDPVTGLPLTPFEIDQLRHQLVAQINAKRELFRVRRDNQAKGFDQPKVGQVIHVQLDSSITRRTRSGMRFERGARIELRVVTDEDYAEAKARSAAAPVVTVLGAEYIIEDNALHVFQSPTDSMELEQLREVHEAIAAELKDARAELAKFRAERQARMSAPESTDGRPTRLPAAAAARAATAKDANAGVPAPKATEPKATEPGVGDFGAPAGEPKK